MPFATIAAAVIGGAMSGGDSTTTQKADPWEGVQPALRELYAKALENFQGGGPQYYSGDTVAGLSPTTNLAQQGIYGLATQRSPVLDSGLQQNYATTEGGYLYSNPAMQDLYNLAGRDFLQSSPAMWDLYDSTGEDFMRSNPGARGLRQTGSGAYLNANPYLNSMFDQASSAVGRQFENNVMPGIASMFSGAGRFGSNQMAEGLGQAEEQYGDTLNDLATRIYGGNYANERGLQQQAQTSLGGLGLSASGQRQQALTNLGQMGLQGQQLQQQALGSLGGLYGDERGNMVRSTSMAPMLDQSRYYGMDRLAGLGAQQDAYNQSLINADMNRWNFNQNAPNNNLQMLAGLLQGYPVNSIQTSPGNPFMGMMGGAQMGQAFGNAFGGGGGSMFSSTPGGVNNWNWGGGW